jgi:hypothetical protein
MLTRTLARMLVLLLALSLLDLGALAAPEYHGQVTFDGLPVPGVTVTATQGDKKLVAITDEQGAYSFTDIADGPWKFQVEMFGFATETQDITISADTPSTVWELKLLPLEEITRQVPVVSPAAESSPALPSAGQSTGPVAAANANATPASSPAGLPSSPPPSKTQRPRLPPTIRRHLHHLRARVIMT